MQSTDDSVLLKEYTENHCDEAFAVLVAKYINLVYSIAMRSIGNSSAAEEITQAVFIIFAQKAGQLRNDKALSSWLFKTTQLTANNFLRSEMRRQHREQEAYDMQTILSEPEPELWPKIAPLLDNAVAALKEKDRRAILLRFYEGKNLQQIGTALGVSEVAVEKRVSRAVEKLQKFFFKRGVTLTAKAITATISVNSIQAAPIGLAKTISAVAITKGAVASGSTLILIKGALKIMAWTKAKTVIVIGVVVLLAAGATTITLNEVQKNKPESQKQTPIIMIAPNGAMKIIPANQINLLPRKKQTNGVAFEIHFKTGDTKEAIVHQLEQVHATILTNTPELLYAEFEKTPTIMKPRQVKLDFTDGKIS